MILTPTQAKAIREHFGLSIPQMAQLVGKHLRTWYRYEGGKQPVDPTVQKLLIVYLKHADVRIAAIGDVVNVGP